MVTDSKIPKIFQEILEERKRQIEKWGEQKHPFPFQLKEVYSQFDEQRIAEHLEIPTINRAKFLTEEHRKQSDNLTWGEILQEEVSEALLSFDKKNIREELIQIGALCVAMIIQLDDE